MLWKCLDKTSIYVCARYFFGILNTQATLVASLKFIAKVLTSVSLITEVNHFFMFTVENSNVAEAKKSCLEFTSCRMTTNLDL